jgi:HJR/Mrr/RecB family endonuclease
MISRWFIEPRFLKKKCPPVKLYNNFQNYVKDYNDDYGWYDFAYFFPSIVELDSELKDFLDDTGRTDFWADVKEEILHEICDELHYLPWREHDNIRNSEMLVQNILSISNSVVSAGLSKVLAGGGFDLDEGFEDGDERIYLDNFRVQGMLGDFVLDNTVLAEAIRLWPEYEIHTVETPKLIKNIRPKIITLSNQFDLKVYKLIAQNPSLLSTMDWRIFEEMLADLLRRFGYEVELTRKTKDGGIDVIALSRTSDFGVHKYILQAKRYSTAVQVSPVRELMYLHHEERATKSCLATTSTFTKGAWQEAQKHRWTLELKDKGGILEWIEKIAKELK